MKPLVSFSPPPLQTRRTRRCRASPDRGRVGRGPRRSCCMSVALLISAASCSSGTTPVRPSVQSRKRSPAWIGTTGHVRPLADFLAAEVLPQHVAEAVVLRLRGGDRLGLDQRLGERVIDRELLNLLVADQVAPAVADARDEDLAALPPDGHHDRRAHVLHVFVEGTHRHDFFVRLDDRPPHDGLHAVAVEVRR